MIKLISSAALGASVIIALGVGSVQAKDGLASFGLGPSDHGTSAHGVTHVMERLSSGTRRDRLGYTVEPRDFSISHLSPERSTRSDRSQPLYRAGQFLFRR